MTKPLVLWRVIEREIGPLHAYPSGTKADAASYCGRITALRVHLIADEGRDRCAECLRRTGGETQ